MPKSQSNIVRLGWELKIGNESIQLLTENLLDISDDQPEKALNKAIEMDVYFKMTPGIVKQLTLGQISDWINSFDKNKDHSFVWPELISEIIKQENKGLSLAKIEVELSDLSITPKGFISFNIWVTKNDIKREMIDSPSLLPHIKELFQESNMGFGISYQMAPINIKEKGAKLVPIQSQEKKNYE